MDPATDAKIDQLVADVGALKAALEEWMPLLRAYFAVDQAGPRGWAVRRAMARANGA